jgi:protein-disulfide isomerase
MSRLSFGLVLLVGILAGGLGVSLLNRGPAPIDDSTVRGIVAEMLTAEAGKTIDPAQLNGLIEDYLMDDPAILDRMSAKLSVAKREAQKQEQVALLQANYAAIYEDPANVVLGNPNGDVTLVEMFDYNCGYCRRALPDIAALIAEDPNLKIILKEFPILSDGSVEAAKVGFLVAENDDLSYWDFHQRLFSVRGQIDGGAALAAAEQVGGNRVAMMIDMNGKKAADALERNYNLATALRISGTPTFIIGDELIPGAVGLEALRDKIANVRACGSTVCDAPTG